MRVKKQKTNRRTIRFYKTCCGFREPFKVLCDGTFLHYLVSHKIGPPAGLLTRLLFTSARPFTTRCVIAELKKLGQDFSGSLSLARKLDAAKCDHEPLKSASDCLESLIGDGNPEHFWVATQDADLRIKLRQLPAVAIILAQNNFLVLEPPSEKQHAFAHADEAQRLHANKREFDIIKARDRKKQEATKVIEDEAKESMEESHKEVSITVQTNAHRKRSSLAVNRPQFKRKRAKGPNPLSCKKKIKKPNNSETQRQGRDAIASKGSKRHRRKGIVAQA